MRVGPRFRTAAIVAASLVLLAAAPRLTPDAPLYLSVSNFGSSASKIVVLSYEIGASGSGPNGPSNMPPLRITKPVDATTPLFMSYHSSGKPITGATTLSFSGHEKGEIETVGSFVLSDVKVVAEALSNNAEGEPIETIAFSYASIKFCRANVCMAYDVRPRTRLAPRTEKKY